MFLSARNHGRQDEAWSKELFNASNAGAEFVLPWIIDRYFSVIETIKTKFSAGELKILLNANPGISFDGPDFKAETFIKEIADLCKKKSMHVLYGTSLENLDKKLRQLDEKQTFFLALWIHAFWQGDSQKDIEKYISLGK